VAAPGPGPVRGRVGRLVTADGAGTPPDAEAIGISPAGAYGQFAQPRHGQREVPERLNLVRDPGVLGRERVQADLVRGFAQPATNSRGT
jgi:hypothetical protein